MFKNKKLKQRIFSALVISVIVAYPIYAGHKWFLGMSIAAVSFCIFEILSSTKSLKQFIFIKALALFYVITGGSAFFLIRQQFGIQITIWLLIATCSTDVFAFIGGKIIGGPKLCPQISPNKTFAGLICGITCSAIASYYFDLFFMDMYLGSIWPSFLIAATSVLGDLYISFIKRKLGIKDFSNLIPGHGGVLDRLDSLFLSSVALYALFIIIGK